MNWTTFLLAITGPIVIRVLATLGFGIVTYTGVSAVIATAANMIQGSLNGLGGDAASLLFMSGIPQGIALILSAVAARASMQVFSKLQRVQ